MRTIMHGHHAGSLFSHLTSLEERVRELKREKPPEEQELRLALIQDVSDLLPDTPKRAANKAWAAYKRTKVAYTKAWATSYLKLAPHYNYKKAWAAHYKKAWVAHTKAWATYLELWAAYLESFDGEAFHKEHCHPQCPWDGETIFARGTDVSVLVG